MILRLVVIGENIFEICLSQCLFEFGFPFGQVALSRKRLKLCRCLQADMATVKRIPLGEKGEKVVVEQAVTVSGGNQDFFSKYISIHQLCKTTFYSLRALGVFNFSLNLSFNWSLHRLVPELKGFCNVKKKQ